MTAKHAMFFALFSTGRVDVTLDARRPGVVLPESLKTDPHLKLAYGLDLANPTSDIHLSDDGIRCTLSFNQIPTPTFVPWAAIYMIATATGGVSFSDDAPPEVLAAARAWAEKTLHDRRAAAASPKLALVDGAPPADAVEPAPEEEPRRPPWLHVVKKEIN